MTPRVGRCRDPSDAGHLPDWYCHDCSDVTRSLDDAVDLRDHGEPDGPQPPPAEDARPDGS